MRSCSHTRVLSGNIIVDNVHCDIFYRWMFSHNVLYSFSQGMAVLSEKKIILVPLLHTHFISVKTKSPKIRCWDLVVTFVWSLAFWFTLVTLTMLWKVIFTKGYLGFISSKANPFCSTVGCSTVGGKLLVRFVCSPLFSEMVSSITKKSRLKMCSV